MCSSRRRCRLPSRRSKRWHDWPKIETSPRIVWRLPAEEILVVERRPVRVLLSGAAVPFPPGGFLQASAAAEAILVEEVLAGTEGHRPALDLFAGLGTFTFAFGRAGPVHAVEGDERAAAALANAAAGHGGITVEGRDLARNPLTPEALIGYTAAVFDPPRAGAARLSRGSGGLDDRADRRGLLQSCHLCARCRPANRRRILPRTRGADRSVRMDAPPRARGIILPIIFD